MFVETVGTLRDIALVLLAIEWIVLAAIPLVILFYITKGLAGLVAKVRPAMRMAHAYVLRGAAAIDRGMRIVRTPFVWLGSDFDKSCSSSLGSSEGAGEGRTA